MRHTHTHTLVEGEEGPAGRRPLEKRALRCAQNTRSEHGAAELGREEHGEGEGADGDEPLGRRVAWAVGPSGMG